MHGIHRKAFTAFLQGIHEIGASSEAIKAYVCYFFEHYDENEIIATIREDNIPSWKAIERVGFSLREKKMYRDLNDTNEELYRFYLAQRN